MKKLLVKEFSPLILFIVSIFLLILLTCFGITHMIIKSIYHLFQCKFYLGPWYFIKYWFRVAYQLWNVCKYFLLKIAIGIDIFGNVACGEAIEDIITYEEKTMFGNGEVTISTATGELEYFDKLNPTGKWFTRTLSKLLDKNHSINSYKRYLHNQNFKLE